MKVKQLRKENIKEDLALILNIKCLKFKNHMIKFIFKIKLLILTYNVLEKKYKNKNV